MADLVRQFSNLPVRHDQLCAGNSATSWWNDLSISAAATQNISEVENIWRELEKNGMQSPGQSIDFTKAWIKNFDIAAGEQLYVTGAAHGKVVALMPLRREKLLGANILGANILTWFFGSHVGCNAPLIDKKALAALGVEERKKLWQRMGRVMIGADLVYLPSMPQIDETDLFDELGTSVAQELLYRAEFDDWDECQRVQRTRSRKKHDKQQRAKLKALGEVGFEELGPGEEAVAAIEVMFAQKAVRFKQMGVNDPFAEEKIQSFYKSLFRGDKVVGAKLHVLKLDDEIIAVRYNLARDEKFFVLITSMSEKEEFRAGSPGKQSALHSVQQIFESGFAVYDMGAGFSDEKRHWCNKKYQLETRYLPLNKKGKLVAKLHRLKTRTRKMIKGNEFLFSAFKSMRLALSKS